MRTFPQSAVTARSARRGARRLGAVTAALAAMMLMGSQPAHASDYWQEIKPNANWHCGTTTPLHKAPAGVVGQTCIIASSSGYAQAVSVISNNSGRAIDFGSFIQSNQIYYENAHHCRPSTLNPGFQRGCLGPSVYVGCKPFTITAHSTWSVDGWGSSVTSRSYTHSC